MKEQKRTIDKVILGFTKEEAALFHRMLKFVVDNSETGHKIKAIDLMIYMDWDNPDPLHKLLTH